MITNFILIMVVLKLASSVPQHDPSGIVELDGISMGSQDSGCIFGGASYATGDYLDDTCLELRCSYGTWTSTGKEPRSVCGRCLAYGDPHIIPYDNLHTLKYETTQTGDFALTQPGFTNPASFGVNGKFVTCAADGAKSCIRSITYNELGIAVKLTLPPPEFAIDWCAENSAHANSKECAITVDVGVDRIPTPGYEAVALKATSGTVLVFKRDHVADANNLYCIAIVGSKGFSMALCQHYKNWPYFYVYAMPYLGRSTESHLNGLCNVYTTGSTPTDYTQRYGGSTSDISTFVSSWKVPSPNQ